MVHLVGKVGLKCKMLVLCRFIVRLPNHINDVWSQLVSEQLMHRMSLKPSKANVEGKGKGVLYPAVPGTVFLELSATVLGGVVIAAIWADGADVGQKIGTVKIPKRTLEGGGSVGSARQAINEAGMEIPLPALCNPGSRVSDALLTLLSSCSAN